MIDEVLQSRLKSIGFIPKGVTASIKEIDVIVGYTHHFGKLHEVHDVHVGYFKGSILCILCIKSRTLIPVPNNQVPAGLFDYFTPEYFDPILYPTFP